MSARESIDINAQSVLLAASNHDIVKLRELLRTTPATVQDPETGFTPLHAAIAACEAEPEQALEPNDKSSDDPEKEGGISREKELEVAADTVRFLFENGAIWNDLDSNDETPGCMARRLGLEEIYGLIVDAGVRAELLLSKLEQYQLLGDDDDSVEDEEDMEMAEETPEEYDETRADAESQDVSRENATYLSNSVAFTSTSLIDSSKNGVMMDWETPIMEKHAALLLPVKGLRVLNIGHGLGIIDTFFQSHQPISHHIVEAHPDVLVRMQEQGWMDKPGVVVHSGRWQEDVLPKLVQGTDDGHELVFDAIFFDTFAEEYNALKELFSEWVVQLLDSEGRFGFFNGMGADRQVCYDVYSKVRRKFQIISQLYSRTKPPLSLNLHAKYVLIPIRLPKWISLKQGST